MPRMYPPQPGGVHPIRILVKVGELVLKGRNRGTFYRILHRNLTRSLEGLDGVRVLSFGSVGVVGVPPAVDPRTVTDRIDRVFGIAAYSVARRAERDVASIAAVAGDLIDADADGLRTFAVRAKRRDKSFPTTSLELEREIGARLLGLFEGGVDLGSPDLVVRVEVDRESAYVFTDKVRGPGGLPVGSTGKALCLLSGGIDSPIAAVESLKRGLSLTFIHFSGEPYVTGKAAEKSFALARVINGFQPVRPGALWTIDFGRDQRALSAAVEPAHRILLYRRQMVRTAEALARRIGAEALVTGDSLGQVSSQTLPNLAAVDRVSTIPLLRPLVTFDKRETMERAAELGILRISEIQAEDACPLFADKPQSTRSPLRILEAAEERLDVDAMAEAAARRARMADPGYFLGRLDPDPRTPGRTTGVRR